MALFIQYLLKLSISLAIVALFYQLVLRRLTFYNSNRWYLLGYSLLAFFIPFINISPVLDKNPAAANGIVDFIPSVQHYTTALEVASHSPAPIWSTAYDKWDWIAFGLMTGAAILLVRFAVRLLSYIKLRRKADLLSADRMRLYQVNENIIPFSFGNAVFINKKLHSDAELQEIIRHEFVHVKQRHTIDIIWAEVLCILNWYNPFAWLLKTAIRQNLEFIADNKVLENGIRKQEYQYLLLKVMGNDQYSIAPKFNFSSLKKRIAMMNKLRTARVHLLRFLFLLPLLAVILISFRQKKDNIDLIETGIAETTLGRDTIPFANEPNDKGYIVYVTGNGPSNAIVTVKDRNGKLVERIPYKKWKADEKYYEGKYGEFPPPPPPSVPKAPPAPPEPPEPIELPANVKSIDVNNKQATVILKDGTVEKYDLGKPEEKSTFNKKYGDVIPQPPPPPPRPGEEEEITAVQEVHRSIAEEFEITDHKAHMRLKDGTTEVYDLSNPKEKKAFEKKYGKVIEVPVKTEGIEMPVEVISVIDGEAVIVPKNVIVPHKMDGGVTWLNEDGTINGEEEILLTITRKTTKQQLDGFVKKMKEKGIELKFNNIEYKDGVLVHIEGSIKIKDGQNESQNSFSATDFSRVILSAVNDGNKTHMQVRVSDGKEEI